MQKRSAAMIIILAFTVAWASLARAQDPVRDCVQIIASQKVVVAMIDRDYPPYILQGQDGQLTGLEVELAQDIAKELGVTLEIVKTDSFDDVIEKVYAGQADIGISNLSITSKRATKVKFTNTYRTLGIVLLLNRMKMAANKHADGMQNLEEFKNTTETIGVIGRSAYEAAARKFFPMAKVKTYDLYRDMIRAVEKGELLFAVGNSGTIDAFLDEKPSLMVTLQTYTVETRQDHIAMAVRIEVDHLLFWLNAYLTTKGLSNK